MYSDCKTCAVLYTLVQYLFYMLVWWYLIPSLHSCLLFLENSYSSFKAHLKYIFLWGAFSYIHSRRELPSALHHYKTPLDGTLE